MATRQLFIFSYKAHDPKKRHLDAPQLSAPHLPSGFWFFLCCAPKAAIPVINRTIKVCLDARGNPSAIPPGILRLVPGAYWANRAEATWIAVPIRHKVALGGHSLFLLCVCLWPRAATAAAPDSQELVPVLWMEFRVRRPPAGESMAEALSEIRPSDKSSLPTSSGVPQIS